MAILRYNARIFEDTSAKLATDNTVYQPNEFICETDTGVMKRGNGVDKYADLGAIGGGEAAGSHSIEADPESGLTAASDLQAAFVAISARVKALEDAGS